MSTKNQLSRRATLALGVAAAVSRPARAQTVTLNFWDMIWGPPEYIETAKALVDQFNAANPAIQVKYRSVAWTNWYQTFVTAIGAGTPPDISTGAGYQAAQLYDMGAIRPLDDVIAELKATGDADDFLPGTIDKLRYDNHTMALPWGVDIRVWLYRKDLLAAAGIAPPTSLAELRSAAKALTTGGKFGLGASGDTGGSHYLYSLMLNNGGGLFDEKRVIGLGSPRNLEALTWFADVVKDGSTSPASAGYDSDARRRAFLTGQAAFLLDGPGLPESAPADQRGNIGVLAPLKGLHGDLGTIAWVNNIMMYKDGKYPEQTKAFLKFWSKNQKPLWTVGHNRPLPARKSIAADAYFTGDATRSFIFANYLPIGKTTGTNAPGMFPQLNTIEGDGVMQALTQEILQGKDLAPAVARADAKLKAIMA